MMYCIKFLDLGLVPILLSIFMAIHPQWLWDHMPGPALSTDILVEVQSIPARE
jgi:hypothetical protein